MSEEEILVKSGLETYENPYNLQVIRRIIREGYGKVPDSPIVTPPVEQVKNEYHTLKRDCMYIYGIKNRRRRRNEVPETTPEISYLVQEYTGPITHMPWSFPPIDELEIPVIKSKGVKRCMEEMSEYFGCIDYEYNLLHFWVLDIITDCIWESQDMFDFNDTVQKHMLRWILFFIDIIRDPKGYSRNEFLYILKESVSVIYGLIRSGDYELYNPVQIIEVPETECDLEEVEGEGKVVGETASTDSVVNILSDVHLKDLSRPPLGQNIKIKRKSAMPTLTEEQKRKCRLACRDYEIVTRAVNTSRLYSKHESTVIQTPFFLNIPSPKTYRTEDETLYTVEEEDLSSAYIMDQLNLTKTPILKADLPDRDVPDTSVDNIPSQMMILPDDEVLLAPRFDMKITFANKKKSTAHVLFSNENAVSDSSVVTESTCSKTLDDVSFVRIATPQIPEIESDRTRAKKIIDALTEYKLKEQRMNNLNDPKIGLSPSEYSEMFVKPQLLLSTPSRSEVSYEPSTDNCDFTERSELERLEKNGNEFNLDTEKGLNACREKQFFSMGILWMINDYVYKNFSDCFQFTLIKLALQMDQNIFTQDLNDDWKTPKLLTEDITKFLKDIKDKYKQVIIRAKVEKTKKDKKGKSKKGDKSSRKSDKKSKKSDKKSKKSDKKSKKTDKKSEMKSKSSKKKGLTESEIKLKLQLEVEEAERIRQEIHAHFLFPLQDAVTDELFQKMFDPWQRTVDWRTGKKIIDPNAKPSKKAKKKK